MGRIQEEREHAPSVGEVVPGIPLVRSVPVFGWKRVRVKANIDVDKDMHKDARKERIRWGFNRFLAWFCSSEYSPTGLRQDAPRFLGEVVVSGPFPHAQFQAPTVQVGDRGGTRLVGHTVQSAVAESGKEDYVIEASFAVREYLQVIDTDVAEDVIGTRGIRPYREKEWQCKSK